MDVLIAEDEFITRNLLQKFIEMMGYQVLVAEDGLQAWDLFQKNDVKMVITDWIMPQTDGLELCKKIRSAGKENYTYIIILTVMDQKDDLIQVFNSGADDYISKPFDNEELKARIKTGERIIQLEEEHKRINDILKNAERNWRAAFNSLEDIMIIIDRDYNIEMINDSGLALIGKSKEEVVGEKCYQIIHGKNSPRERCPFRESLKTKKPSSAETYEDLFGKHFSIKSSPIFDENGEIIKFADLIRDITENKRAEEMLRGSEEKYRLLVNNIPGIVYKGYKDWSIEIFDDKIEGVTGYSMNQFNSKEIKWSDIIVEEDIGHAKRTFINALKTDKTYIRNYRIKTKDGNIVWIQERGQIIVKQDSDIDYISGVFNDITSQKQTEEKLRQHERQLLQSERMASIGQLAAGVAHEINNPTGFVSSNLKTLMDYHNDLNQLIKEYRKLVTDSKETITDNNLSPALSEQIEKVATLETEVDIEFLQEDIQDLIKDCREGTERIKKIVIDLKDFAHPGEDKLQVADINNGMESILNVVSNELKYKATVTKDFGVLPDVKCYPQKLNQVFMNILVNAAQAIEKQGEINIKTRHVNGHVEIAISDTGSGIEEENLNKIFDPFFTTKDVGKGTGLGMNIAYNIIKKHNGTIDVESKVGEGTTFIIRIPAE